MTSNKKLLYTGIGGTVIAALCCFTPLLVVLFGVVGLSAWLGWIDYVLFPALGFFMLLTVYALYRQRTHPQAAGTVYALYRQRTHPQAAGNTGTEGSGAKT